MSDARFSDTLLAQIKDAVPISELIGQHVVWDKGRSSRGDFWACCPFHNESGPSFHADDRKAFYKCFVCGDKAGDHFNFLMQLTGCDFPEAVRQVAEMGGVSLPDRPAAPSQPRQEARPSAPAPEAPPEQEGPPAEAPEAVRVHVKGYRYTDGDGNALYEVIRDHFKLPDGSFVLGKAGNPKKTFWQRRPDGRGGYITGLGDVAHTIYRRQAVEIAIAEGKTILLPEGEKDVETVEEWGFVGATNSGGAQNWSPALAAMFAGADVVILGDDDEAGRKRVETIGMSLRGLAKRIRAIGSWGGPKDVTDWKEAGHTADELSAIVGQLPDWRPAPPKSQFGASTSRQMSTSKIVYDWLVKGLIERGGVFIVAGEKQAGKSFFIMDMGKKIARGIDYADRKVKRGLVIHMACEDGNGVRMRSKGYDLDNHLSPDDDLPFIVMDKAFTLMSDEVVDKFIAECLDWQEFYKLKLELIIIDTFSMATEGLDEIHSGEIGKVLARVNRIAAKTQSAVCLVHHLNGEGKRVRGHSSLTANVSQVIEIRQMTKFQTHRNAPVELIRDSEGRVVRQAILEKNKNGPNQIKWRFILRNVPLGRDDDDYEISTCVLDTPSSDVKEGEQSKSRLSQDQKLILDCLVETLEDDGIDMPGGVRVGPQIRRAAPEKAFVAHVRKKWQFRAAAEETEARNKELQDVLKRNVTALLNMGYIGRDGDKAILWNFGKDDRRREPPAPVEKPQTSPLMTPDDMAVPF
jgi:archaellum biogenesis ATPase FlaH